MDRKALANEIMTLAKHLTGSGGRINGKQGAAFAKIQVAGDTVSVTATIQESYRSGLFDGDPKDAIQKSLDAAEAAFLSEMEKHYED